MHGLPFGSDSRCVRMKYFASLLVSLIDVFLASDNERGYFLRRFEDDDQALCFECLGAKCEYINVLALDRLPIFSKYYMVPVRPLRLHEGWCHIACIIGAFTRKVATNMCAFGAPCEAAKSVDSCSIFI